MHPSAYMCSGFLLLSFILTHFVRSEIIEDPLERDYGKVVHASLIFRHGDRNPEITFPSDPYRKYPWRGGLGGLTDVGKRRLVQLGLWFKRHYQYLINETYSPEQIRIDSSGIDRAIMSCQCFLYGFYPTTETDRWLGNERWQPIPIHTIEPHQDNIIANIKRCEMYTKQMDDRYFPVYEQFKDIVHYIENQTGLNLKDAHMRRIFNTLAQIEDTFLIYGERNLTVPSWFSVVFPEPLQTILSKTHRDPTFSARKSRFEAGLLFKSIISDMQRKIYDGYFQQALHLYSGHDITIRRCLIALRAFDGQRLPYGTTVIIELRHKENTTYYVTVSFKNETFGSPYLIKIPDCADLDCTFQQFENLTRTLIPNDLEKECEIPSIRVPSYLYSPYVLLSLVAFFIICVLYCKIKSNNNKVAKSKFASPKT